MASMPERLDVPSYAELKHGDGRRPAGSAWHVFGEGDQLGTVNFISEQQVRAALGTVRTGRTINLDYPVNAFVPSIAGTRPPTRHTIFSNNPHHRDDWLDSFYLQSTSQIDGLRHISHPQHGFFGGVAEERIDVGTPELGVQALAERGIVSRGVLLDVPGHFAEIGRDYDVTTCVRITPVDLDEIAARQEVEIRPGDVLLLYFGWAERYLSLAVPERSTMSQKPGLDQSEAMLAWLWDHQIAVVAADNPGVEAIPVHRDSGWFAAEAPPPARGPSHNGLMHRQLIALLGMTLGELWKLDELTRHCRSAQQYDFLLMAKPLNLVGGVGSPPQAMAIV